MRVCCAERRRPGCRRAGFTLAELVVTLAITGLLGGVVFSTIVVQLRLAQATASRALDNDAVRTTTAVIAGEVRRAVPADVRSLAADSLALRSFRGLALRCAADDGSIVVRYRGDRLPDARKDSVLVLTGAAPRAAALLDAQSAAGALCTAQPGEQLLRMSLDDDAGDEVGDESAAVLLVFESGRYFLATRALRYRLGAEGRQPLTAEAFRHPFTRFDDAAGPLVRFTLAVGDRGLSEHAARFAPPPHW